MKNVSTTKSKIIQTESKYYLPHFTHQELACRESGKVVLATGFADKLTELRAKFAKPMVVTSCCRSWTYNQKVRGARGSYHIYDRPSHNGGGTCAIDITTPNSNYRGALIAIAWKLGWTIGIHKKFLHLDRRSDYSALEQIVFVY